MFSVVSPGRSFTGLRRLEVEIDSFLSSGIFCVPDPGLGRMSGPLRREEERPGVGEAQLHTSLGQLGGGEQPGRLDLPSLHLAQLRHPQSDKVSLPVIVKGLLYRVELPVLPRVIPNPCKYKILTTD